jgi:predicted dehydrogenase
MGDHVMALQPIRIGIIGCGDVLSAYMAMAGKLRQRGLVEVVIACAKSEAKRAFVQQTYGIPAFTTDYRELVQKSDIDLVLVLTPAQTHASLVQAALEAGKHVLVEKPMATTLAEAAKLVELAKQSPGYLLCAPFVLLSPTYQIMGQRIHDGVIGKIRSARARYGWAGPWWADWFYRDGAGAIFDFGVYNMTSLTGWLGPVKRVMAMTGIAIPEREVCGQKIQVEAEDNAHILLDFGEALFAVVTTNFTMQRYRCPAIELYGNEGTLQMLGDDWAPQGYELWQNQLGSWQVFYETDLFWAWTDGLRHLVECIQHRTPPICTPEHAYHVLEVMRKAQEAGKDGKARRIESIFPPPAFAPKVEGEPAHLVHDPRGRHL